MGESTTDMTNRADDFHRLHAAGCFVIPNPWDAGSARVLAQLGFKALATTSSGFAWSQGRPDNGVSLDDAIAHFRAIAASVDIPVNGDFEGGFAIEPAGVAANVSDRGQEAPAATRCDLPRRERRARASHPW